MKKIIFICVAFLTVSIPGFAQQFLNIYQDKVVIKQISTEEIDSMSVVEAEPRLISMWKNGEVFLTYTSAEIDSIVVTNQGGDPLSYIGIVGFNDQLYKKEIGILSKSTASEYKSFVNSLPCKDGTLLYYAVDNALDMLDNANIETPLKNVNLITFTDGLDQGSLMITDKYASSTDYLNAMSNRIARTKVSGHSVNAFSVGLRGKDVTNEALFKQNLQRLASSPSNAFEVSNINELRERFREIANQIISVSNRQTMSVKIPGIDNGTRIRFVFDGYSAENSKLYIEGTFNLQDRSLHNVTYHGLKATSGKTVQGTQDGIFVRYTFTGMRLESSEGLIPTSSVRHYYRLPSATSWQLNSEFKPSSDTQTSISHSGTTIFLVLDCSSSLGSDFRRMQQYANEFIEMIASNAEPFYLNTPQNVKAVIEEKNNNLVVNVSWNAVKYAQTYKVYRNSNYSGTYQLIAENIAATTWTDNSPLSGYNYYKVCAVNRNNLSSQSSYADVNVELGAPTNVKATLDDNDLKVDVSWDAVKYAKSYKVYRCSRYNGTYELVAENVTSTTWTDSSPLSGDNYYKVCAVGYSLTSSQSSYAYVTNVKLNAPTNVKAEMDLKNGKFVVNVAWDVVKRAKNYNIYRSSYNGSYELVAENVTKTSWTDNNPLEGNNYYKVSAVNHDIYSSQSSYASVNVKLDAPTNVTTTIDENDLIVHVSWDVVKFAQNYSIYRKGNSGDYELIAENLTSTTWTDNSPLSGSNYYKVCAFGYGFTNYIYASVNVKLDTPKNVTAAVDDNDLIVNISWDAVKRAQSYKVYRCSSYNGTYSIVAENVTSTAWTDNNPLSGNNYYKICAINRNITSSQSSYTNVNIKLDTPTNVKAAIDDNDLIVNVSWDTVKRAQSYKVYRCSSSSGTYELVAENVTSTTWTDSSPLSGSNYYIIRAINCNITSYESSYAYVTNVKLDAPTNVKAEVVENEFAVHVSWNAVKRAQNYQIYRINSSKGTYELVAENVTGTTWKDDNSFIGFNYYKVCAVNRNFTSSQSSVASVYYVPEAKTAIDLGLPSGTLWASCNVGAMKAEMYGYHFAWGETKGYTRNTSNGHYFNWENYKWCNGSSSSLTKYTGSDGKTELDLEDDAAYVNWGSSWQMPSKEQQDELRSQCKWEWTQLNGVYGYKVTGPNGNSIFLPAAGGSVGFVGSFGYYWSRTFSTSNAYYAYYLNLGDDVVWSSVDRYYGLSVRPVRR